MVQQYDWLGQPLSPPEVQSYAGERYPATLIDENEAHALDLIAVSVAALTEKSVQKFMNGLTRMLYPDTTADIFAVPAASGGIPGKVQNMFSFPGFVRLKKLELFAPGGVYPSQVDVVIDKISHQPFTLTEKNATIGPFGFQLMGGGNVVFSNPDAANSANVYIEWEMVCFSEHGG